MYESEPLDQQYGDRLYLAHKIKGDSPENARALFGMRMPSYGIFSFGAMAARQQKTIVLANEGIVSPIQLKSVYAFNPNASSDEIRFRLYAGTQELAGMRLTANDMPFQFPDGAIIDPALSIQVEPRYSVTQLMLYWQPVHILKYVAVT